MCDKLVKPYKYIIITIESFFNNNMCIELLESLVNIITYYFFVLKDFSK